MIPQMTVTDLKAKLDAGEDFLLLDVREPNEWEIARIDGAHLLPLSKFADEWETTLSDHREKPIVVHCKMGGRSQRVCEFLAAQGFSDLANVAGGITAWADHIDPTIPKY